MNDGRTISVRRTPRRRAYVLAAVLAVALLVSALGTAFLESHGTVMPEAVNYHRAVRAQYLAESGVAIAAHFLMYPPTTVAVDDYYRGGNNIGVDGSIDFTNVLVQRSDEWTPPETDLNLYRIRATGVAHDPDGSVRAKRSVTAEVIVTPSDQWQLPYGFLAKSTITIPANVQITGNVHCNGILTGWGWCNGDVSASGVATWLGSGPPASVKSLQPAIPAPSANVGNYYSYTLNGNNYTAYYYNKSSLSKSDADALNAIDMSATNPARIIQAMSGDFTIMANAALNGTLVVDSNLIIDGYGIVLTAVSGFPALVVDQHIEVTKDNLTTVINGAVIAGGQLNLNGNRGVTFRVVGPLILSQDIQNTNGTGTAVQLQQDPGRSVFHNFDSGPTPQPITYLSWKEE